MHFEAWKIVLGIVETAICLFGIRKGYIAKNKQFIVLLAQPFVWLLFLGVNLLEHSLAVDIVMLTILAALGYESWKTLKTKGRAALGMETENIKVSLLSAETFYITLICLISFMLFMAASITIYTWGQQSQYNGVSIVAMLAIVALAITLALFVKHFVEWLMRL